LGAPENLHPGTAKPVSDALIWPPPAGDMDVLWLDGDPPPAAVARSSPDRTTPSLSRSDRSVPLSRLKSPGVTVEWHDAVALLQQLVDQLAPDRARPPAGSVPALDAINIEPSGRLVAALNPPGEPFVKGLGRLFNELLQSNPAPANLRLLAWQAASDSAAPIRLDELGRQLAGWERPGRAAALVALYGRAANATPEVSLPTLTAQPTRTPTPTAAAAIEAPKPDASLRKRRTAYLSAVACVAVVAAGFAWYSIRQTSVGPVVTADTAGSDIELPQMTTGRRLRSGAAVNRSVEASVPRRIDVPRTGLLSNRQPQARTGTMPGSLEQPTLELSAAEAPPIPIPQPSIFTNDDSTVVEPQLIRPYLPFRAHTGTPPDALGVLELVVDAHGAVESVHLNSPDNRYRERWWVFAAKNWQFRPAMKNGTPVRFLKRIPLTDLNMLEPQ
jgi:hypothetical protein